LYELCAANKEDEDETDRSSTILISYIMEKLNEDQDRD